MFELQDPRTRSRRRTGLGNFAEYALRLLFGRRSARGRNRGRPRLSTDGMDGAWLFLDAVRELDGERERGVGSDAAAGSQRLDGFERETELAFLGP